MNKSRLSRVQKTNVKHYCSSCKSTKSKRGFLKLFGERMCDNTDCIESKTTKQRLIIIENEINNLKEFTGFDQF